MFSRALGQEFLMFSAVELLAIEYTSSMLLDNANIFCEDFRPSFYY